MDYRIWLFVCFSWAFLKQSLLMKESCLNGTLLINVVLLDDDVSPWSINFVKPAVMRAVESDSEINFKDGVNLSVSFRGFQTIYYQKTGCSSSACEGVEILNDLANAGEEGCALLGPTCTYATFQMADLEIGLNLNMPIISAGSFGLSCDLKRDLTRLLPPARKISSFFINFWKFHDPVKPKWETAYLYKKPDNTEDCFWYINALEVSNGGFSPSLQEIEVIRNKEDLTKAMAKHNRESNLFILCGTPDDIMDLKNGTTDYDSEIAFLLIDLYNDIYYKGQSNTFMRNVLVLTMPNTRKYTIDTSGNNTMNDYIAAYHDAVLLFGQVMRNIQKSGSLDIQDMESVSMNYFRNVSFTGIAGEYQLDQHGDRDLMFSLIYTNNNNQYNILYQFNTSNNKTGLKDSSPSFIWQSRLPNDSPSKGLSVIEIIVIVLCTVIGIMGTLAFIFYWQNRYYHHMQKRWSHISSQLITPLELNEWNMISLKIEEDSTENSTYILRRARYDKKIVILKEFRLTDGSFTEKQRIELNTLLKIDYCNLTKFYGTVKFDNEYFGVFEYGERGSLRYVLDDKISYPEETFMDWQFKISVMYDIAKGMSYLHTSNIAVHGRLKSTNCVVDNRMVVKIADFGFNTIVSPSEDLWTAPEHLRKPGISQKGDVYSFAIISQEIMMRKCTFYTNTCSDRAEKLARVQYPSTTSFFRPDLNFESTSESEEEVCMLIRNCWDEDPDRRPDFKKIEIALWKIVSRDNQEHESYMENLIRRLQMYSRNLERLVEERTALYKAERDRADCLNFMLLPGPVVRSLKETGKVEPELFDEVTIYFSDIVGFTTLCHFSTPMEVVDMLNDIYKNFDSILDNHDVYKVETIGDAYMVVSGLPRRNGNRHAKDICLMALDILAFMGTIQLSHLPGIPVWIRIGVHSGPCAAGVVGIKMPRYCLFGDTVNTASRMESTGLPLRIHVSQSTINILQRTDCKFEYEERGETFLKGKGKEMTYWLTGVTGENYNLPTPPTAENFQNLQQDLSEMIKTCLQKRPSGLWRRKTLSARHRKLMVGVEMETTDQPEYLHLATGDFLSTYL
ncbi:guanylyl cyclase C isoform X1 [Danio rerio]|uniref:Guanylyl cyclase C isoform X1 n=3 Tax=Danio rerio TaxID=7955 RepID=A0ACD6B6Z2_DANRE|nr:heat-stable enterotoxin receptor-like [Danio rerio]|eukprot:XP_021329920.1 heat-stable enterotoxin receptor-like [Danio rerio]